MAAEQRRPHRSIAALFHRTLSTASGSSGRYGQSVDVSAALADTTPRSFWLDDPERPPRLAPLVGDVRADLVVVGGGYTGLWAALLAARADPSRSIVVIEAEQCGDAASGRNGGFCAATLTHGLANGLDRWPNEIDELQRLGMENLDAMAQTVADLSIDCQFERTGALDVATEPWQVEGLRHAEEQARAHGVDVEFLDGPQVQRAVHSPTYLAGLWDRTGCAMVHPARLAWGLRAACLEAGVVIHEGTRAAAFERGATRSGAPLVVRTPQGTVTAERVALATNASPALRRHLRRYVVPVYDYVLMTEPLNSEQMRSIGWEGRQGVGGVGNQFLYYRLSADQRILFGGYDAIYHYGNRIGPELEQRSTSFRDLAHRFQETFPTLEDVRFTHSWAGAIDTCSRFCAFFDRSADGRMASAAGFTGMGVGASRFAAQVILDLVDGADTERTALAMVRTKPIPFPPEPLRSIGINLTRWSLARADARDGRRNLWLQALDRAGMGFDS